MNSSDSSDSIITPQLPTSNRRSLYQVRLSISFCFSSPVVVSRQSSKQNQWVGMVKRTKKKPGRISFLSDDLIGLILSKVAEKRDRKSFSGVCKQWYKVEGLSRTSLYIRFSRPYFSVRTLSAIYPNVVSLTISNPRLDTVLETIVHACPQLEAIDLMAYGFHLGRKGLAALGIGCPNLPTVSLVGYEIVRAGVAWLVKSAMHLKSLKLGSSLVKDHTFGVIASSSITTLELKDCCNLTDQGLAFLANGSISRTIKKLVVRSCSRVTDTGIEHLQNMCGLEHLEIEDWEDGTFSDIGGVAISKIQTLKTLKLRYVLDMSNATVDALVEDCHS